MSMIALPSLIAVIFVNFVVMMIVDFPLANKMSIFYGGLVLIIAGIDLALETRK